MCKIAKNKRKPRQEEVPDQTEMPGRITVRHTRRDQSDTYGTSHIQQDKDCHVMPVAKEKIPKSIGHGFRLI